LRTETRDSLGTTHTLQCNETLFTKDHKTMRTLNKKLKVDDTSKIQYYGLETKTTIINF